ncbi:hypothetical protein [Halorarum salinum]|uniref:Uncharacterized protein n=1 Tax=Halorarum salinum TaxID=2743089 RepID=A0A7D5QDD9_9EURY|nr:hypothetical protein [Halobaculum salinum]QLG62021.1 hypothetical protein HUG12_09910 [Halobaculum salinum]
MSTTQVIKTARRDIYRNLVLRTARLELDDGEELDKDPYEYPFDYGYELFAAGLAIGFLHKDYREESKGSYSQDFTDVDSVSSDEVRTAITFIWELIKMEEDEKTETEAWELARQYADAGVERISRDMEVKDQFDLLGFMNMAENRWEDRVEDVVGSVESEEVASA